MRQRKVFNYEKVKYYFVIKSIPNDIKLHRLSKEEAVDAFLKYKAVKKKIEWLGVWNGKKFEEKSEPTESLVKD